MRLHPDLIANLQEWEVLVVTNPIYYTIEIKEELNESEEKIKDEE